MRSPLLTFLPGHCAIREATCNRMKDWPPGGKLCSHLESALVPAQGREVTEAQSRAKRACCFKWDTPGRGSKFSPGEKAHKTVLGTIKTTHFGGRQPWAWGAALILVAVWLCAGGHIISLL